MRLDLDSPERQETLGRRLAPLLTGRCLVFLSGELGTGKTTLVRGILQGLGHRGPVRSPTYTLIEPYEFSHRPVFHLDLYRLGDPQELDYLGIRDLLAEDSLVLIEWPERGAGALPSADLAIHLAYSAHGGRILTLMADTGHGAAILAALRA